MTFTIYKEPQPPRIIRMGGTPVTVKPAVVEQPVIPDAPPEPVKNKRGRPKKMADEKRLGQETGVKKIHEEDAGKQGPIGTGAEKQPATGPTEDVTLGNQESEKNG